MATHAFHSLRTKLVGGFLAALALTLAMAALLYFGAQAMESNARRASAADNDVNDLLGFALVSHRYMSAFEHSLGQRTIVANNERRLAAEQFEAGIRRMSAADPTRALFIDWPSLRAISAELAGELAAADVQRAAGHFSEAERLYVSARKRRFEKQMLPWFEQAITAQRSQAEQLERAALRHARMLRIWGGVLALAAALMAALVLLMSSRALLRPIDLLLEGTDAIARGDYSHRIDYDYPNELGVLAQRFDAMAAVVEQGQHALLEKNAALEQAYTTQGEFLSVMSHELRSPLHSILGYTELVLDDAEALPALVRRNVHAIATGARRLLGLINDILDFSRLKVGGVPLRNAAFDPVRLAEEAIEDARALVQGRPVEVKLELASGVTAPSRALISDETKLRQIITNLLGNAVKFCDRGQVVLRLEQLGDTLVLQVRDTGSGIADDQLARIFEPFRQAEGAGLHAQGGTGLGLAIVSRLARLLGGEVSVTSTLGMGSAFEVRLPAREG